jgi:hypothetical protein
MQVFVGVKTNLSADRWEWNASRVAQVETHSGQTAHVTFDENREQ